MKVMSHEKKVPEYSDDTGLNEQYEVMREVVNWLPVVAILAMFGIIFIVIMVLNVISGVEGESMITKLFKFDNFVQLTWKNYRIE